MNKLLQIAFTQYGIAEIPGDKANPEITKYFTQTGFEAEKLNEDTSWCCAFMNWVLKTAGKTHPHALNARSYLKLGYRVESPQPGDIVVLWRESRDSWKGHVGLFVNKLSDKIFIFGGNQGNAVNISPYNEIQLLEYRRI